MWVPVDAGEATIVVVDDDSSQVDAGDTAIVLLDEDFSQGSHGFAWHPSIPDRVLTAAVVPTCLRPDWSAMQLTPPVAVKETENKTFKPSEHPEAQWPDWSAMGSNSPPTKGAPPETSKKVIGAPITSRAALESLKTDVGGRRSVIQACVTPERKPAKYDCKASVEKAGKKRRV